MLAGWDELLEANVRAAQQRGELAPDADIAQLVFELNALLHEANGHYLLFRDPAALTERARRSPTGSRSHRLSEPQNTFALSQSAAKNATKNGAIAHMSGWMPRALPVATMTST